MSLHFYFTVIKLLNWEVDIVVGVDTFAVFVNLNAQVRCACELDV